jgi:hypothetical protein
MKITEIYESTTSGSVATVAQPMTTQARNASIYGDKKAGNLLTGKKTNKKYANSVSESGMPASVLKNKQKLAKMTDAELASHLKGKSDDELKQMAWRHGYGKMSPHYVNRIKKVTESTDTSKYKVQIICDDGGETSYTVYAKTKEEAWRKATKFANDDGYEDFQAKIITEPSKKPVRESVGYPGIKDDEELREFQQYPDAFSLYNKLRKDGVAFTKVHPRGKNRVDFDIVMNDRRHSLQMRAPGAMYEAQLDEEDLILVPGQGHRLKTGFIPHGESRIDHEVEMAKSDLFSAAKNAKQVYEMIADVSEEEGLEGWVQEKIIKANDYLNTIREYLEGKQLQEMTDGVIAEDTDSNFHKVQFENHAKLALGYEDASRECRNRYWKIDRIGADYSRQRDYEKTRSRYCRNKSIEHFEQAAKHAAAYHKMTGKKVTMVPRAYDSPGAPHGKFKNGQGRNYDEKHVHDAGIETDREDNQHYLPTSQRVTDSEQVRKESTAGLLK